MLVTRRHFISGAATAGALAGFGNSSFLSGLPRVSAGDAKLDTGTVRLRPEIEPLVRLLEETPRERLLEEVGHRIKAGKAAYKEVLTALLLAGVRNVQPRPVGFKFHSVLVINSAHLASLSSPDSDRWLPIFWALDYFKDSQARDVKEGDWTMEAVDEARVPGADKAADTLSEALDNWDESATDVSAAGFARSTKPQAAFELFARYGMRDFRDIGHKAIYVANSFRTLEHIGWQHAEPVLRSLAYALLAHEGGNPAKGDAEADRPWRKNRELARQLKATWDAGKGEKGVAQEMLRALRDGSPDDAARVAVDLLRGGASVQFLWDAMLDGAAELSMRRAGLISLHASTTTNALYYAFRNTKDDDTRRMLLLQNASFLPMFRQVMGNNLPDEKIDDLKPTEMKAEGPAAIDEIFADTSANRPLAARKALGYLRAGHDAKPLIDAARQLVFLKGNNAHDYKFSSAVLEDYYNASPAWRDQLLATSVYLLRGSGDKDNELVKRTKAALT